jgi:hypothetical protein
VLKAAPELLGFGAGQPHFPMGRLSDSGLQRLAELMRSGGVSLPDKL